MKRLIIAGCGTEIGKTVVSAIFSTILKADYWKPIDCGREQKDSEQIKKFVHFKQIIHPSAYRFDYDLSPHHGAFLDKKSIDEEKIVVPQTKNCLVIESVGGILVPINYQMLTLDLFAKWQAHWIIVSKHYLGSINHTLLTVEALKKRQLSILGIVFNGSPNEQTESAILTFTKLPCLGRLLPEETLNFSIIQKYAKEWKKTCMFL